MRPKKDTYYIQGTHIISKDCPIWIDGCPEPSEQMAKLAELMEMNSDRYTRISAFAERQSKAIRFESGLDAQQPLPLIIGFSMLEIVLIQQKLIFEGDDKDRMLIDLLSIEIGVQKNEGPMAVNRSLVVQYVLSDKI